MNPKSLLAKQFSIHKSLSALCLASFFLLGVAVPDCRSGLSLLNKETDERAREAHFKYLSNLAAVLLDLQKNDDSSKDVCDIKDILNQEIEDSPWRRYFRTLNGLKPNDEAVVLKTIKQADAELKGSFRDKWLEWCENPGNFLSWMIAPLSESSEGKNAESLVDIVLRDSNRVEELRNVNKGFLYLLKLAKGNGCKEKLKWFHPNSKKPYIAQRPVKEEPRQPLNDSPLPSNEEGEAYNKEVEQVKKLSGIRQERADGGLSEPQVRGSLNLTAQHRELSFFEKAEQILVKNMQGKPYAFTVKGNGSMDALFNEFFEQSKNEENIDDGQQVIFQKFYDHLKDENKRLFALSLLNFVMVKDIEKALEGIGPKNDKLTQCESSFPSRSSWRAEGVAIQFELLNGHALRARHDEMENELSHRAKLIYSDLKMYKIYFDHKREFLLDMNDEELLTNFITKVNTSFCYGSKSKVAVIKLEKLVRFYVPVLKDINQSESWQEQIENCVKKLNHGDLFYDTNFLGFYSNHLLRKSLSLEKWEENPFEPI